MFSINLMVTTKQKPTIDSQKIKERDSKHNTMENHQFKRKAAREEDRSKGNYKTARK